MFGTKQPASDVTYLMNLILHCQQHNDVLLLSHPEQLRYLKSQAILQNNFYFLYFQRYPTDRAYFIAKEILMTERTYKKDLEILNLVSGFSRIVPSFLPQTFYILQPSRQVQTTIQCMLQYQNKVLNTSIGNILKYHYQYGFSKYTCPVSVFYRNT